MDIRGARPPGPPTISIYDDDRFGSNQRPFGSHGPFNPSFDRTFSPGGIGIPNAPSHENAPPALPPPRFVPVDGPQAHHNDFFERQRKESYVNSESFFGGRSENGYGSWKSRATPDDFADYRRRESNTTLTGKDEGYSSLSSYTSSMYVFADSFLRVLGNTRAHLGRYLAKRLSTNVLLIGHETKAPVSAYTTSINSPPATHTIASSSRGWTQRKAWIIVCRPADLR